MFASAQEVVNLWPQEAPVASVDKNDKAELTVFLPEKKHATGRAIVICPGGGYGFLAMQHEGTDWAPFFNQMGIAVFVLKYRLPHGDSSVPMTDAEEAMRYVEGILASLQDADYRKLAETLFSRRKEQFKTVPAAKSIHHGFRNGLLMHTANMLQTAEFLSDLYAEVVNRDLLLTGTLLHDMAKIREFTFSPLGAVRDYSVEGRLLGHPFMGAQEVAEAAQALGVPQEKSVLLQHLLLSHHGEPEFGAAVLPMCAEAELLHLIDLIDSRMEIYAETLQDLPAGSFSDRIYALEKRIYKLPEAENEKSS
jgi:23S rRNA maturation-related 3'-5' exoribonuclease YhaM